MTTDMIGRVVIATAGRERGKLFAVVGTTEEGYLLIADGRHRKLAGAKRKKRRHLRFTEQRLANLQERLAGDRGAVDAYLRSELTGLCQDLEDNMEEG